MPASDKRHDPSPSRGTQDQPLCRFAGIRPTQTKPRLFLEVARNERDELLRQIDCWLVDAGKQTAKHRSLQLLMNCLANAPVAVPETRQRPTGTEVEITTPIDIEQVR